MSYSVSSNRVAKTDLRSDVVTKLAAVPEGPGREEAGRHRPVIESALDVLAEGITSDEVAFSVSGSVSGTSASLSINLQPAHD